MGWVIFFAGCVAILTCPIKYEMRASTANAGRATAMVVAMWFAWALVVIAMIAGLVIVEVRP